MIYPYIFLFDIFAILSLSGKMKKSPLQQAQTELGLGITLLSIFILAVFVGVNSKRADYEAYLKIFKTSPLIGADDFFSYAKSQHTEFGYNYFQSLIKTIGGSATVFFIIFCFTSFLFRYSFYVGFVSKRDIGIVFLAFFAHEFLRKDCVQIRNGFASAIVLYSLVFLYRKQRMRFILEILFASTFQMTSLVALPLVIARTERSAKYEKFLLLLFIISFIISVLFPIKKMFYILERVGVLPPAVANYLYWSEYSKAMSLLNPQVLKQLVICVYVWKNRHYFFKDKKIFFLFQIYLVSTVYYLVFRDFEILAGRFGSLFYAVEAPMLVLIVSHAKKNVFLKKFALCGFYFCFLLLNVRTYTALGWNPQWN